MRTAATELPVLESRHPIAGTGLDMLDFREGEGERYGAGTSPGPLRRHRRSDAETSPSLSGIMPVPVHRDIYSGNPPPFQPEGGGRATFDFAKLFHLSETNQREDALDLTVDYFDDLLIERRFAECDAALRSFDERAVRRVFLSILVSILGITLRAKTHLPSRSAFFDRAFAEVARRKGRRYAGALLDKYR